MINYSEHFCYLFIKKEPVSFDLVLIFRNSMVQNIALVVSAVYKWERCENFSVHTSIMQLFSYEVWNQIQESLYIKILESVQLKIILVLKFKVLFVQDCWILLEVDVGVHFVGLNVDVVIFIRWLFYLLGSLIIRIFFKEGLFHFEFQRRVVKNFLVQSCRRNHLSNYLSLTLSENAYKVLVPYVEIRPIFEHFLIGICQWLVPVYLSLVAHVFLIYWKWLEA